MRDVNSAILQAYYEIIDGLDIPVYEGEEPDDVKHKIYCVINDATSTETSTFNSSDVNLTIQLSVHSWEYKYNNSKTLNTACGQIIEAIKPTSTTNLDLSSFGLQMSNLSLQTDRTERFGNLGGKVFISRILIFKQDIFVIS
ncbi:hypothetical protein UFOVP535_7 [uncultured Caudovirales phage]|jgi:hypothetical protein|uniref:Uncharacterized protein n=1 Tax=uncultured Caudovirales phage TaxID=2100421 RepID=A0A6J5MTW9_9CAUD|nr:hypothetical protein UFOVP535_7 [uncultured Caudovirales phage]